MKQCNVETYVYDDKQQRQQRSTITSWNQKTLSFITIITKTARVENTDF